MVNSCIFLQDNLFDLTVSVAYPAFLLTRFGLPGVLPSDISITHVGGTKHNFLAFHDVYMMLGRYVSWELVLGGSGSHAKCVEFETAVTLGEWVNAF